jgi:hypothetical protein
MVHWYTVTQLWSCVPSASQSTSIYIVVVHWYTVTQLWSCVPFGSPSTSIYIAVVHWYTVTQLCYCVPSASPATSIYIAVVHWCTGTLSHSSDLVYPLLPPSTSIYITVVHWYTVTQLWSCVPSASQSTYLNCDGSLVHCHTTLILCTLCFPINFNLYCGGTLVHCHTTLFLCTLCFPINFNLHCGGTLVHFHTSQILCTLCLPINYIFAVRRLSFCIITQTQRWFTAFIVHWEKEWMLKLETKHCIRLCTNCCISKSIYQNCLKSINE